ncbi:hypothetical protein SEA_GRAVAILLIA_40 [Mycobacterium phage Gravaillia]|nr:hypothetical protein SEA_GRAVAILLIA_40 [Mycobacterium phage Gravaillia]
MMADHVDECPASHGGRTCRCPVDLGAVGAFANLVKPCAAVPDGEVWVGPADSDPLRAFGPGTTVGGRAEAGWICVGRTVGDSPKIVTDR